ncbi:hypothetical protein PR202_ga06890 [Eleusine coracana subsp. coracana]|uniref:Uncharacterized protein n=1 Tax=Eleusine coracana subsp. coracana TaxID=191504 RepID=A0AAV5BWI3_ELECO|nr:hypothetical protein PR202_ga06890 [Eleusine coracana subsp. coracana]
MSARLHFRRESPDIELAASSMAAASSIFPVSSLLPVRTAVGDAESGHRDRRVRGARSRRDEDGGGGGCRRRWILLHKAP